MAPTFKREAKRTSRFWTLLRVIFVYIAYLALWKCPVTQPLPASSGCCSVPCSLLHQAVDSQLRPLWEQHGQHHYAKVEPYVAPAFAVVKARAEPVVLSAQAKVHDLYTAHAKVHVDKVHALAEPYTAQIADTWHYLEPHRSTVRTHLGPWADAAATKGRAWGIAGYKWSLVKLREFDTWLHPHLERGVNSTSAFISAQAQTAADRLQEHWHAGLEAAASWISQRLPGGDDVPVPAAEVTLDEPLSEELPVPTLESTEAEPKIQTVPVSDSTKQKQAKIQTVPVEEKVKIQTVPVGEDSSQSASSESASSSSSTTTVPSSSSTVAGTVPRDVPVQQASDFISKEAPAPASASPSKLGWPQRVERTSKNALKNLEQDCHDAQERIISESKPDIVAKLRDLSAFGEQAARELTELTLSVEAGEAEYETEMDLFTVYDKKAAKVQNMMLEVRGACEDMAAVVINKMSALRQEAAESLEDFFEAVLSEASKEAAAQSGHDDDEWSSWQAIGKLKKQLGETRKTIEGHEPDMELVNNALRESQQAAILLAQDVSQHLRALRGRAQFHIQQEGLLRAKANADKPVDAIFEDLTEDEEEQRQHVLGLAKDEAEEEELEQELAQEELGEELETEAEAEAEVNEVTSDEASEADETETTYVTSVVYRTRFNTHSL